MILSTLDFNSISLNGPVLLTIGTFDGVHRGHQHLLQQAASRAREHSYHLVVVTFDPCPAVVLHPEVGRYQLTSAGQKLHFLSEIDPAAVVTMPFTLELAQMTADQFLDAMQGRLKLSEIWMGEDFRFGRGRAGGLELLVLRGSRDGFSLHVVPRQLEHHTTISSTRIRQLLTIGDVQGIIPLLGRPFGTEVNDPDQYELIGGSAVQLASYVVAPHLALPASGTYAALVSDTAGQKAAAAVEVQLDLPKQLRVISGTIPPRATLVEFIDRINGIAPLSLLDTAEALLKEWERPTFEPAGTY